MLGPLLATAGAGAAAVAAYAVGIERNWFALRHHTIDCLPPGSAPLRVLHLSDLHLRSVQRRKQEWLRSLASVEPDLIVGTGDFLGDDVSTDAVVATVTSIPSRLGAVFTLGSNDYYGPRPKNPLRYFKEHSTVKPKGVPNPWEDLVTGLREAGWLVLFNETARVGDIEIVGLDDAHIGRARLEAAAPRTHPGFRLAVTHSPDAAPALAERGFDLIVCGHTHGGQVCVPGFGALVTNSHLPREMARGAHRFEGTWLHVCGGLGTSMYAPYRFACRPEACVLELVPTT